MIGFGVLLFSHFPPDGSRRFEEATTSDSETNDTN